MQINYKDELNPEQYKAVTSIEGPILIIAGAGSGKTRVITFRMSYMLENGIDINDEKSVCAALENVQVDLAYQDGAQRVLLCGEDVSETIFSLIIRQWRKPLSERTGRKY